MQDITQEQITAGAKWLARVVKRMSWDGLRADGRAADRGFDPWLYDNARQEDYRDAVRAILAEVVATQQLRTTEGK